GQAVAVGDLLEVEAARRLGQPFVAGCPFHDVGVASDFIFGDDARGRLGIGHLLADGLNGLPSELLGASTAPLAGDELENAVLRQGSNENRRALPADAHRFDELFLLLVVEAGSVLEWRWSNCGDRNGSKCGVLAHTVPPSGWVAPPRPAARAQPETRARSEPAKSGLIAVLVAAVGACLLRVKGRGALSRFGLANCCSIELRQLSRNSPIHPRSDPFSKRSSANLLRRHPPGFPFRH